MVVVRGEDGRSVSPRMTATRLSDDGVLLAGGYPNNDRVTAQTWLESAILSAKGMLRQLSGVSAD